MSHSLFVDACAGHTPRVLDRTDHTCWWRGSDKEYTTGGQPGIHGRAQPRQILWALAMCSVKSPSLNEGRSDHGSSAIGKRCSVKDADNEVNSRCLLNLHNASSKTQHECVSITCVSVSQSIQKNWHKSSKPTRFINRLRSLSGSGKLMLMAASIVDVWPLFLLPVALYRPLPLLLA
jgi:hypothetical protein